MSAEDGERLIGHGQRGEQGERGKQGNRGEAGLSRTVRRALVFLFALSVLLAGINLGWTAYEKGAIQAGQHREQVLQQQAGVMLEAKLCTTFGRLAALKPPPGNPKTNPSRAFDQELHVTLDELGTDLGCKAA